MAIHQLNKAAPECVCEICRNNRDFTLTEQLLDAFRAGEVVIFAGAGVSTEGRGVLPFTFYDEIAQEMDIEPEKGLDFAALMSKYCSKLNGRQDMLLRIKKRFDYIASFDELHRNATRFHQELSTLHHVQDIVTTNWDSFFEEKCNATPYVSAEDFALWRFPGRKVFKIHGSINSLGSIIATSEDYERCYNALSKGLMGSQLKMLLATKTIVYVGYSLSDSDFQQIHSILTEEMRGMRPHSYIVTLDESAGQKFSTLNMTPIVTAGDHFLRRVKEHLIKEGSLISDAAFDGLFGIYGKVQKAHKQVCDLSLARFPIALLTATYQDGLIHGLERLMSRKFTGELSCPDHIPNQAAVYQDIRKLKARNRALSDVSYIDGYVNGLMLLLAPEAARSSLPIFYGYGLKSHPADLRGYKEYLGSAERVHRSSFVWCERFIQNSKFAPGIIFHHPPVLM
jgi:NAD-dependent SIR2 family protein deacetylase